MDFETKLAAALGGVPSTGQQKLAKALSELSIEELEDIVRSEGVEKQASQPTKSDAFFGGGGMGGVIGLAGRKNMKGAKKLASADEEKLKLADEAGRVMAKTAFIGGVANTVMRSGLGTRMLGGAAVGAGGAALTGQNPLAGAAAGAGLGAAAPSAVRFGARHSNMLSGSMMRNAVQQGKKAPKGLVKEVGGLRGKYLQGQMKDIKGGMKDLKGKALGKAQKNLASHQTALQATRAGKVDKLVG